MKTLCRFVQLPWSRKVLLLEAAGWLALAWLLVRTMPFRVWSRWLGTQSSGEVDLVGVERDPRVRDICLAITSISARLGDRLTCLMLAMAAQWMLSRREISSSLVLGTRTEQDAQKRLVIKAHAWVRVGSGVVLGHHEEGYIPISSFVRYHPSPERQAE
ncbi:lasso peptide biosynthesis B2 protein [Halomonas korlensis]|uniref:Transglutaminase-like superfamily protein n=1 Tax=Halomonas korlensis TaxID=463301 RepID=A0A1I7FAC3_9GAMM|nr:lasso peptide biosynthesis B2 protein [Halomonas korlensis]SFU33132.1 Transglutaminase-like superfamily protein [Halomonas korlensis]